MIDDAQLATTEIATSCRIAPLKNVIGDLSDIVSRYHSELVGAFYPRLVSRKVNAALTELIDNVLQNFVDADSGMTIDLTIAKERLTVRVSSVATPEQFQQVRSVIDTLQTTPDVRSLLRDTLRERRKHRLRGGLGLLRLAAENRFDLDATFDQSVLAVETRIALGGLT